MYADGKVTAVVDWELAHLGDPMDDIAWLSLGDSEPFRLPNRRVSTKRCRATSSTRPAVRYYQVMAETKLQVMSHRGPRDGDGDDDKGGGGNDVGNGFISQVLHRRLWLEALAAANGLGLRPPRRPGPGTLATATGCTTPSSPSSAT